MQTTLRPEILETTAGREADRILRRCVHCGFCTATCPTYQILGDELDSPRGRIYLIKSWLEGHSDGTQLQQHLDRCLTCRACETTCPSGVEYGHLVDMARSRVESELSRPLLQRLQRWLLCRVLPFSTRFQWTLKCGQIIKPLLPESIRKQVPDSQQAVVHKPKQHPRKLLLLSACVQSGLQPGIDMAAKRLLDGFGITLETIKGSGCCGAVSQHLGQSKDAVAFMRQNIDAWWPEIEAGAEGIISSSSGCGVQLKDYGWLLKDDEEYAERAQIISDKVVDIAQVLLREDVSRLQRARSAPVTIAFHAPCSLQHGMKQSGSVEMLLKKTGFHLTHVNDEHLCCGSAGTYSILQPQLAEKLKMKKLSNLQAELPALIATANIGCLMFMQQDAKVSVKHWIELLKVDLER